VVDDDPQIRDLIGRCLIEFGASVTPCEDAFAAVEVIKKVQPDVVLADLVMPGRYGLDLLYEIRSCGAEHGGDVPAIIITGLHDPDLESEIRKGGFGYLAKPFTRSSYSTRSFRLWVCYLHQSGRWPNLLCSLTRLRRSLDLSIQHADRPHNS
jgi:CheY-like chemotaxis protein